MEEVLITAADHNTTFEVRAGTTLKIRLDENPTTGFLWTLRTDDQGVVALRRSEYELPQGIVFGAGGQRIFTLIADGPGAANVSLKHWQEWEGETSVTDRLRFRIKVVRKDEQYS